MGIHSGVLLSNIVVEYNDQSNINCSGRHFQRSKMFFLVSAGPKKRKESSEVSIMYLALYVCTEQ